MPPLETGLARNLGIGVRLSFLRPVQREDMAVSAEAFAALVLVNLSVLFLLSFASVGINGQFNYYEMPRALLGVPLLLLVGLLVGRANEDPRATLILAIGLTAAGTVISAVVGGLALMVQHQIGAIDGHNWRYIQYFAYAWWAVVIAVTILRLTPARLGGSVRNVAAGLAILIVPAWWLPQGAVWIAAYDPDAEQRAYSRFGSLAEEKGFYAQQDALARALARLQPERPGIADLYLVAAGLYAPEDVFMQEVKVIEALFRDRFDTGGRALVLINNPKALQEYPLASLTSLAASLRHVGKLMNPEEDVLVLYLSSHGSETHQLSVDFWPLRLEPIDPPRLKRALDESGIKWKVIVVSACYSGGFIEPLKDDHTLIITASSATKQSFGCGNDSDSTYLAKALFDEALRKTYSFEAAFENARRSIAQRERVEDHLSSDPQIYIGAAVRKKLEEIEQRLAARPSAPSR